MSKPRNVEPKQMTAYDEFRAKITEQQKQRAVPKNEWIQKCVTAYMIYKGLPEKYEPEARRYCEKQYGMTTLFKLEHELKTSSQITAMIEEDMKHG